MACKGRKLAPFNPSGDEVIQTALDMLQLTGEDLFYDLGCGDGRILVEAVKRSGARGVGIEYDERHFERAKQRVLQSGLQDQIVIRHDNVLDVEIGEATAIFIYLVPEGIKALRDRLLSMLRTGVRIVTYVFSIPGLTPAREERFKATKIMLYTRDSLGTAGREPEGTQSDKLQVEAGAVHGPSNGSVACGPQATGPSPLERTGGDGDPPPGWGQSARLDRGCEAADGMLPES